MNVTSTWTGPSRAVGLRLVAVRTAALTASRQGPTALLDSIMRPLSTYFFDPCGAGIPWTRMNRSGTGCPLPCAPLAFGDSLSLAPGFFVAPQALWAPALAANADELRPASLAEPPPSRSVSPSEVFPAGHRLQVIRV